MASVFEGKTIFSLKWRPVDERPLSEDEMYPLIENIEVVSGNYGPVAEITLQDEGAVYLSISRETECSIGETVDKEKCFLVTLKRGSATCDKLKW